MITLINVFLRETPILYSKGTVCEVSACNATIEFGSFVDSLIPIGKPDSQCLKPLKVFAIINYHVSASKVFADVESEAKSYHVKPNCSMSDFENNRERDGPL